MECLVRKFKDTGAGIVVFGHQDFKGNMVLNNAVIPPTITDPTEWFKRAVLDYISILHTYSAKATIWKGISFVGSYSYGGRWSGHDRSFQRSKIGVIPRCFYYYNKGNNNALTRQVSIDVFYELMESWTDRKKIAKIGSNPVVFACREF